MHLVRCFSNLIHWSGTIQNFESIYFLIMNMFAYCIKNTIDIISNYNVIIK